jgi:hypothetical protein
MCRGAKILRTNALYHLRRSKQQLQNCPNKFDLIYIILFKLISFFFAYHIHQFDKLSVIFAAFNDLDHIKKFIYF